MKANIFLVCRRSSLAPFTDHVGDAERRPLTSRHGTTGDNNEVVQSPFFTAPAGLFRERDRRDVGPASDDPTLAVARPRKSEWATAIAAQS